MYYILELFELTGQKNEIEFGINTLLKSDVDDDMHSLLCDMIYQHKYGFVKIVHE
jgi:hypothetical protein